MYDCEGVISNDAKINRIYDKYVQEQMIRALDNATEYQAIVDNLKTGQPLLSNQIETLKDSLEDYFPEGFDRDQIQHVMKELYFIITSDDSYIPNLMEEYVLANCIDTMQDVINMDESLLIPMPQRDEVKTAITEYRNFTPHKSTSHSDQCFSCFICSAAIQTSSPVIITTLGFLPCTCAMAFS